MNSPVSSAAPPASEPFNLERRAPAPFNLERRTPLRATTSAPRELDSGAAAPARALTAELVALQARGADDGSRRLGSIELRPGFIVGDRYRITSTLGKGAMGTLYKAKHVELGTPVAVKVVRPDVEPNGRVWRRFAREARALAALHNKHVVRVHDSGTLEGQRLYVVMELLVGENLSEHLKKHGPLPVERAVDITLEVCSALGEAHRHNIIHRDIKPKSVFLARYAACEPTVKLLDFGWALFQDEPGRGTLPGRGAGLPCYPSPEYMRDPSCVDRRSDIWAVGHLLQELLGERSEVPEQLADVVRRCVAEDPALRPQTAEELTQLLEPFTSRRAAARRAAANVQGPPRRRAPR